VTTAPSIRRRLIGAALTRYRENLGYTLEDPARILGCDRSKISRIESGQRGIRPRELRQLLTEFGVPEGEQDVLVSLAGWTRPLGWWDWHPGMTEHTAEYLLLESLAAEVMICGPQLVPNLLQTEDYARAVLAALPGGLAGEKQDQAIAALTERQDSVLDGSRQVSVVLGEAAIRHQMGGLDTVTAQLRHLIDLAGGIRGVTVQVLPFAAGAHAVTADAPYVIMRFPGAPSLGAVYLPGLSGGAWLADQADLARYLSAFALARASALTAPQTIGLLQEITGDQRAPWE